MTSSKVGKSLSSSELAWPQLAALIQLASNAENAVAKSPGEIEVACTILRGRMRGLSFDAAARAAKASAADLSSVAALQKLAEFFGAKDGAQLLVRLDLFLKSLQYCVKLGSQYIMAVATTDAPYVDNAFPYMRLALLTANLTCPPAEVVDGVARLLGVGDVAGLLKQRATKPHELALRQLDEWLQRAVSLCGMSENDAIDILHKHMVRQVLFLRGKQHKGFEAREFKDMAEIEGATSYDFSKAISAGAKNPCGWTIVEPLAVVQPQAAPKAAGCDRGIADMSDVTVALGDKGYAVDAFVMEKGGSVMNNCFRITKIDAKTHVISLSKVTLGVMPEFKTTVQAEARVKKFSVVSKVDTLPKTMPIQVSERTIENTVRFKNDAAKAEVFIAMAQDTGSPHDAFTYLVNGKRLFSKVAFKAKELVMLPRCQLGGIRDVTLTGVGPSHHSATAIVNDVKYTFTLGAPATSVNVEPSQWTSDVAFEPFWWVQTTSDEEKANVVIQSRDQGTVSYPFMTNPKGIPKNTELLMFVEKAKTLSVQQQAAADRLAKRKAAEPSAADAKKKAK